VSEKGDSGSRHESSTPEDPTQGRGADLSQLRSCQVTQSLPYSWSVALYS